MLSFDTIITAAKPAANWSNTALAQFHYFNPNGLCAAKKAMDDEIDKLVEEGLAKNGAWIAYGALNMYSRDQLSKLAMKNRVEGTELRVALSSLQRDIKYAKGFVEEKRNLQTV